MSMFLWEGLRIRWNSDTDAALQGSSEGMDTIAGVLGMRGFTPETGKILNCHIIRDESLPLGSMVIEPIDK